MSRAMEKMQQRDIAFQGPEDTHEQVCVDTTRYASFPSINKIVGKLKLLLTTIVVDSLVSETIEDFPMAITLMGIMDCPTILIHIASHYVSNSILPTIDSHSTNMLCQMIMQNVFTTAQFNVQHHMYNCLCVGAAHRRSL